MRKLWDKMKKHNSRQTEYCNEFISFWRRPSLRTSSPSTQAHSAHIQQTLPPPSPPPPNLILVGPKHWRITLPIFFLVAYPCAPCSVSCSCLLRAAVNIESGGKRGAHQHRTTWVVEFLTEWHLCRVLQYFVCAQYAAHKKSDKNGKAKIELPKTNIHPD